MGTQVINVGDAAFVPVRTPEAMVMRVMKTNKRPVRRSPSHRGETQLLTTTTTNGMHVRLIDGPTWEVIQLDEGPRHFAPGGYQERATTSTVLVRLALICAAITYMVMLTELGRNLAGRDHAIAVEPPAQSALETLPTVALRMGPVSTGVIAVDDAVRGFLNGDVNEALSQLVVREVRCGTLPWGGMPALTCLAAEAPGTLNEMVLTGCEAKWVTGEAAQTELRTLIADTPGLSSVSQVSGGYRALLSWPDALDRSLVLGISSLGVTSYSTGCGPTLASGAGHELLFASTPGR